MTNKETFSEELLSAYLDGEVSDSERASIEAALESQPELQKLHADFLAIREGLKSVSKPAAPKEFASQVMRRVNSHDSVVATKDQANDQQSKLASSNTTLRSEPRIEDRGWQRGLVWSILAIGAAVLVMIFLSEPNGLKVAGTSTNGQGEVTNDDGHEGIAENATVIASDATGDSIGKIGSADPADVAAMVSEQPASQHQQANRHNSFPRSATNDNVAAEQVGVHEIVATDEATAEFADSQKVRHGAEQVIRLSLADEASLRQLAKKYDVRFVSQSVPEDLSSKMLMIESPQEDIDAIVQQLAVRDHEANGFFA